MFILNPDVLPKLLESPQVKEVMEAIEAEVAKPIPDVRRLTFLRAYGSVMVVYMEAGLPPAEALSVASYLVASTTRRTAMRTQKSFEETLEIVIAEVRRLIEANSRSKAQA